MSRLLRRFDAASHILPPLFRHTLISLLLFTSRQPPRFAAAATMPLLPPPPCRDAYYAIMVTCHAV